MVTVTASARAMQTVYLRLSVTFVIAWECVAPRNLRQGFRESKFLHAKKRPGCRNKPAAGLFLYDRESSN